MTTLGLQRCAALVAVLVLALVITAPSAVASTITLAPGSSTSSVPLNLGAFPAAPATLLDNTGFESFTSGSLSGTFEARVYDVGGDLDFFYIVTDNATTGSPASTENISALVLPGFAGSTLAEAYDNFPSGGITPSSVALNSGGNTVTFGFASPNIDPGQRSFWVEIDTTAAGFATGTATIDGSSGDSATVASLVSTPEPAESLLLGIGLLGLLAFEARRRRQIA